MHPPDYLVKNCCDVISLESLLYRMVGALPVSIC